MSTIDPKRRYCDWCLSGSRGAPVLSAFGDDGECPRHGGSPNGVSGEALGGLLEVLAVSTPAPSTDTLDTAMADVRLERARQEAKWGEQNHDPFAYLTILMEEVGELAQAALHTRYGGRAGGIAHMREEAVQAAAVAVAIVECLDRGKWRWGGHAAPGEPEERLVSIAHEAAIECGRPACSWCYRQAGHEKLTRSQREKLEHALALDYPHKIRDGITYRNYFCAPEGDADMEALVALDLMRRGAAINEGRDRYYHATEAGMALCGIKGVTS